MTDAAQNQLKTGTYWRKTVALALLLSGAKDVAKDESKKIYEDKTEFVPLRTSAFQVFLLSAETADGQKLAVDALANDKLPAPLQRIALTFLARGGRDLNYLAESLWIRSSGTEYESYGQGQIRQVKIPAGLKPEPLTPLLQSEDHMIAAYAGYLLCLLNKHEGLPPVVRFWGEQKESGNSNATELVYTAITALDDDSQTPVLGQIYAASSKDRYSLREFYWTIRAMHGPKVLALRKNMRDEVGMEQLQ